MRIWLARPNPHTIHPRCAAGLHFTTATATTRTATSITAQTSGATASMVAGTTWGASNGAKSTCHARHVWTPSSEPTILATLGTTSVAATTAPQTSTVTGASRELWNGCGHIPATLTRCA